MPKKNLNKEINDIIKEKNIHVTEYSILNETDEEIEINFKGKKERKVPKDQGFTQKQLSQLAFLINTAVDESVNKAVDKAVNETINKAVNEAVDRAINEKLNKAIEQVVNRILDERLHKAVEQAVDSCLLYTSDAADEAKRV